MSAMRYWRWLSKKMTPTRETARLALVCDPPMDGSLPESTFPYPVELSARDWHQEKPKGGGTECFDTPPALAINKARLEHLESLNLPLAGRTVLDVGCGIGHLAQFFVKQRCSVTCVDGRSENIASLRQRYPGLPAHVADVQAVSMDKFGKFDVVFSYGLLYHLDNPVSGLRNLAAACNDLLLLETVICDSKKSVVEFVDENLTTNQALLPLACRPSPSFVTLALNRIGFPHVYQPITSPQHQDFRFYWRDQLEHQRDGHLLRCVFVASRRPLKNANLRSLLQ